MWTKNLYLIAKYELKKIIRDTNLLTLFIIAPILYPVLYGVIYLDKVETEVPVAVLNEDNSPLSRSLISSLDAHQNISITKYLSNEHEISEYIELDNGNAVVMIPDNFSKKIYNKEQTSVELFISPNRLLVAGDIGFPISELTNAFSAKISAKLLETKGIPAARQTDLLLPIKTNFVNLFNPYVTYGDLVLALLFTMIIVQITVISCAASSAREWGNKWINTFSVTSNPFTILSGKLFTILNIYLIASIFIFLVWVPLFDINIYSPSLILLIIMIIAISANTVFGLLIGTFFKRKVTVMLALGFTTYPFFFLSGVIWPSSQIPMALQYIGYILPSTPTLRSIYFAAQMGSNISVIINYLLIGVGQFIIYGTLYMLRLNQIHKKIHLENI